MSDDLLPWDEATAAYPAHPKPQRNPDDYLFMLTLRKAEWEDIHFALLCREEAEDYAAKCDTRSEQVNHVRKRETIRRVIDAIEDMLRDNADPRTTDGPLG